MSESMQDACARMAEHLVAYVDGELAGVEFDAVHAHVGTCLPCRREIERLERLTVLLATRPRIEPSAALGAALEQRLAQNRPSAWPGARRTAGWGVAFAAAAAVVLVLGSVLGQGRVSTRHDAVAVAVDRVTEAPAPAKLAPARAAATPRVKAELATVKATDELMPEDLPPDLLERPELYLRLPVVRRLEKLEHFEAVRSRTDDDRIGHGPRAPKDVWWG